MGTDQPSDLIDLLYSKLSWIMTKYNINFYHEKQTAAVGSNNSMTLNTMVRCIYCPWEAKTVIKGKAFSLTG